MLCYAMLCYAMLGESAPAAGKGKGKGAAAEAEGAPAAESAVPAARCAHSATRLSCGVVVFGGSGARGASRDPNRYTPPAPPPLVT